MRPKRQRTLKAAACSQRLDSTEHGALEDFLGEFRQRTPWLGSDDRRGVEHIIRELVTNAFKANMKRAFRNGAVGPGPRGGGAAAFRSAIEDNADSLLHQATRAGLYVRLELYAAEDVVQVCVINNSALLASERRRLKDALEEAPRSAAALLASERPRREGGGLGLAMARQMLKNLACSGALSFVGGRRETRFVLELSREKS